MRGGTTNTILKRPKQYFAVTFPSIGIETSFLFLFCPSNMPHPGLNVKQNFNDHRIQGRVKSHINEGSIEAFAMVTRLVSASWLPAVP